MTLLSVCLTVWFVLTNNDDDDDNAVVCAVAYFSVRWPVVAVLSDRSFVKASDAKTLDMRDDHWQLMEDLLPVLQPLQVVTSLLSSETTPSSSTVYPLIMKLKTQTLAANPDDSAAVQAFKSDLNRALTDRFKLDDQATPTHPFVVASVLDPATKALENCSVQFRQTAYAHVRSLIPAAPSEPATVTTPEMETETAPEQKKVKLSNRAATLQFLGLSGTSATLEVDELDRYLSTPVNPDVDALSWWADNRSLFPQTASVAARYLGIPATSVMSERQFSAAGRLVTKLRSRLEPDRVDTVLFLYKNM